MSDYRGWVEAAAPEIPIAMNHDEDVVTYQERVARAALAAVVPLIEADVGERIATEVRQWTERFGVNVGNEDDEWWRGYRQAQREMVHDGRAFADRIARAVATGDDTHTCDCPPCPGRGNDGHGHTHCAECCFGTGVEADPACPIHGDDTHTGGEHA